MGMNDIVISKMTHDDILAVYEIEKDAFPIPWPIERLEEELNNMLATYLVAKIDDKIIGYIGMWFVMDECHIMNVAVHSKYRRKKVASMLVNKMLELCKEHETRVAILEVRANNFSAQSLYSKFGFASEVVRKGYYKNPDNTREDAIVMVKENF